MRSGTLLEWRYVDGMMYSLSFLLLPGSGEHGAIGPQEQLEIWTEQIYAPLRLTTQPHSRILHKINHTSLLNPPFCTVGCPGWRVCVSFFCASFSGARFQTQR